MIKFVLFHFNEKRIYLAIRSTYKQKAFIFFVIIFRCNILVVPIYICTYNILAVFIWLWCILFSSWSTFFLPLSLFLKNIHILFAKIYQKSTAHFHIQQIKQKQPTHYEIIKKNHSKWKASGFFYSYLAFKLNNICSGNIF